MPVEKKVINKFLNQDDEPHSLLEDEALLICNMRFGTTDSGQTGRWENIPANTAIATSLIDAAKDTVIKALSDEAGRYIVYCVYNADGNHKILLYYKPDNSFWEVLEDTKLNFSKDYLVVASINPDNHVLYWTDNQEEPRRINLMAAIRMNHAGSSPIEVSWQYTSITDAYDFSLIRRPPCLTGSIVKDQDNTFPSTFIANESFQFAYQYVYFDGEQSVLSAYTTASRLNVIDGKQNRIRVTLNSDELIPESVRFVRLAVIYANKGFFVKTWDRNKPTDAADINGHNGGGRLTFDFYNDLTGELVDNALLTTPYHSVPIKSGTIEIAKNRLFLGNNIEGYDAPVTTSLETGYTSDNIQNQNPSLPVFLIKHNRKGKSGDSNINGYAYAGYFVNIEMNQQKGYWLIPGTDKYNTAASEIPPYPTLDTPPTIIAASGLVYKGYTLDDVAVNTTPPEAGKAGYTVNKSVIEQSFTITVTGLSSFTVNVFKSRSRYRLGTVFYDKAMRKCSVVTNNGLYRTIPPRDYGYTNGVTSITWKLNNSNTLEEIPHWAHYYSVVMTRNLRTRFFLQFMDNAMFYAGKDSEGTWKKADDVYQSKTAIKTTGIAASMKSLVQAGLGYNFTEGDLAVLTDESGKTTELPVMDTQADMLILSAIDLGTIANKKYIIEIYTPYKPTEQEPFYEMGEIISIENAGTISRAYSRLVGSFAPDSYAMTRNYGTLTYLAETMSPNDKLWKRWEGDWGRANLVSDLGQKHKKTNISFSNTYVPGTQTNGLSAFEALNEDNLPVEMGTIMSLVLTSKVQSEGTVMLAIGQQQSASVYIGEAQITDATGATAYFVKSTGVISQINILRGDYGTMHPESVVSYKGNVYWLDAGSGRFVQYSVNGLDPISHYKLRRFTAQFCKKLLATPKATIEAFGSRPFVFGGVDPLHEEVLWTLPKLSEVPHNPLSDFDPIIDYPYDIADFKGKTIAYKIGADKWQGQFDYEAEGFVTLDTDLYSFKNGVLWEHGDTSAYNKFYGAAVKSRLMVVCNAEPSKIKVFESISLEGSDAPDWVHVRCEHPYEQSSDLIKNEFIAKEGIYYASILRDRLTPDFGTYEEALLMGDEMRDSVAKVLLQWEATDKLIYVRAINIGFNFSTGHTT